MLKRILNKVGRLGNDVVFNTGLFSSSRLKNTENTILMYHGVDAAGGAAFNRRHTSKSNFSRHVLFLKKHCHIISLEDFFEKRFIAGKPNIALTFDDGYRNNFLYAKPILEEAKVHGTFYITGLNTSTNNILWADFLNIASALTNQLLHIEGEAFGKKNDVYHSLDTGKNLYTIIKDEKADTEYKALMMHAFVDLPDFKSDPTYEDYWKLMTDPEIALCGKSKFIEIGSHGFLHNNLGTIALAKASKEISDSKMYLENIIQKDIFSIGYPDGSYSRDVLSVSENLGFRYQTAAEGFLFDEDEGDYRILDRKGIYSCDSCANDLMIDL